MRKTRKVSYAGMAELADARDLKSREIFSRTGSTPASGTINIAEWSSLVARRAHNPKVMRFKSHLRNQKEKAPLTQFLIRILTAYRWFSVCRTDSFGCPSYSVLWG